MLAYEPHIKLNHGCKVAWSLARITQVEHLARLLLNRAADLLNDVKLLRVYFLGVLLWCLLLWLIVYPKNASNSLREADLLTRWFRRVVSHGAAYLLNLRLQIYLCLSHEGGLIVLLHDINEASRGLHLLTGVEIFSCAFSRLLNRFFLLYLHQMLL